MYPQISAVEYKTPSQQYNSTDLATDILLSCMAGTRTKKKNPPPKKTVDTTSVKELNTLTVETVIQKNKHIQKPWSKTSVPKDRIWH